MLNLPPIRQLLRSALRRLARRLDPPHPDQTLGNVTYAQHGEDIVLLEVFRVLAVPQPRYLDIGAHHPIYISNTALLYERGACGVNVEANPNLIGAFRDLRPRDVTLNVAVGATPGMIDLYFIDDFSGRNTCDLAVARNFVAKHPQFGIQKKVQVPVTSVKDIYDRHFSPQNIDLLSIDIEGLDFEVLTSTFADHIFPKVVVVEIDCGTDSQQAPSIRNLLEESGYFIYLRLGANYVAIHHDFRHLFA